VGDERNSMPWGVEGKLPGRPGVGRVPRVVTAAVLGVLTAVATPVGVCWAGRTRRLGVVTGPWAVAFWTVAAGDLALQANQPSTEVFSTPA